MSTPKKNVVYVFYLPLVDASATGKFKAAPTLAAGDAKVSTDGGTFANLATLPTVTPTGSVSVKVSLSVAEMGANKVVVTFIDVAGAEWSDVFVFIDAPDENVIGLARSETPANKLKIDVTGKVEGVVLVDTTTTNTDMRGTDSAALATVCTEVRLSELDEATAGKMANEVDIIKVDAAAILVDTGTAGVVLAVGSVDSSAIATSGANEIRDAILSDSTPFLGASVASILTQVNKIPEGIKKNTVLNDVGFVMYDVTDHVSPISGRTVAGSRSIDGGAFVAVTGTFAEVANGAYVFDAAAADTNGDFIMWRFTATGADDVFIPFKTTP